MEVELTIKDKTIHPIIIQHDDLTFDGKTITIPGYYVNTILDYIKNWKVAAEKQVDVEDYVLFRNFLYDIQEHKNQGN